MANLITVTIDGRTVQVPAGTNLVEAAKTAGIEIPVFCYHPKLDPAGLCRMCLVQIEKMPKPAAACVTTASDGMVVHTNTQVVDDLRKGSLEFLLLNHPLDCPVCDKGGECDLQDLTLEHGPSVSRMDMPKMNKPKAVDLGNFIVLDNERCILCRRCVRFDNEISTEGNLIVEERGHHNLITTLAEQPYDSYFSGNTIELCPVGALTSDLYRFQARPWDLSKVESVCHGCSVGCNVNEEFRHGKLLRLTARDNAAIDQGWMCDRGRFNYQFVHAEERITSPLVKKDGQFVPVSWSEALKTIAEKFTTLKAKSPDAIGFIGGGKLTNEESYLLQKFARTVAGTNNVDHRVDDQILASLATFPGKQTDLSEADAILVVDLDPAQVAPVLDLRIRRMADRKKARLAIVGSVMPTYRGRHARIQVRPGQVAGVISALAAVAAGKALAASAADPDAVTALSALLTNAKKVAVVWSGNDANVGRAVIDLASNLKKAASAGNAGRSVHVLIPGSQNNSRGAEAMGALPTYLPGHANVTDKAAREAAAKVWGTRNLPTEAGLTTGGMLAAAAEGKVKALYLAGANLMNTYTDRKLVASALENAFVVVSDLFLNETALQADVVLPAASISEKSGTYTTLDGIVQTVKAARKTAGSIQPDADILVALASIMGSRLANSPAETASEIAKLATRLEEGATLAGAPAAMLQSGAAATVVDADLVLVPVKHLYAGGSTAQFDKAFNHVLPKPEATFNPLDAEKLGITAGETVRISSGDSALELTAQINKNVVAGTVQVVRGLSAAPVNALTTAGAVVGVTVSKLAVEVAH